MSVTPYTNAGKVLTRQALNSSGTTLTFNFPSDQAAQLRAVSKTLLIKKDKTPPMALLARQALTHYLALLSDPASREVERRRLGALVTREPCPRRPAKPAGTP